MYAIIKIFLIWIFSIWFWYLTISYIQSSQENQLYTQLNNQCDTIQNCPIKWDKVLEGEITATSFSSMIDWADVITIDDNYSFAFNWGNCMGHSSCKSYYSRIIWLKNKNNIMSYSSLKKGNYIKIYQKNSNKNIYYIIEFLDSMNCQHSIVSQNTEVCCDDIIQWVNFTQLWQIYAKTTKQVYFINNRKNEVSYCDLLKVDAGSFTNVGDVYGKDKYNVYYYNNKLKWADINSFEVINDKPLEYAIPKWHKERPVELKDLAKDEKHIFSSWTVQLWISPLWFMPMGRNVYKDKINGVYTIINGNVINADADYESFVYNTIARTWQDKDNVYFLNQWKKLQKYPWADPATFHLVDCWESDNFCYYDYVKDENYVYKNWIWEIIPWADPATFEYFGSLTFARDKNAIYRYSTKLNINPHKAVEYPWNTSSWPGMITDGNNIYRNEVLMTKTKLVEYLNWNRDKDKIVSWLQQQWININVSYEELKKEYIQRYNNVYKIIKLCIPNIKRSPDLNTHLNDDEYYENYVRWFEETFLITDLESRFLTEIEFLYNNFIETFKWDCWLESLLEVK